MLNQILAFARFVVVVNAVVMGASACGGERAAVGEQCKPFSDASEDAVACDDGLVCVIDEAKEDGLCKTVTIDKPCDDLVGKAHAACPQEQVVVGCGGADGAITSLLCGEEVSSSDG